MAGSKSDYLENAILDHCLGGPDYIRPATVYIALFTVVPTDAGGGTEVADGSYERASVTNDVTNWPASSGGTKTNGEKITFITATADWGRVLAFGIMDALSGGNCLYWGNLVKSRVISDGVTIIFPAGSLIITEQ